jgi:sugar lactone lactonase YvrE
LRGRAIWRIGKDGRAHAVVGTGRRGAPAAAQLASATALRTPEGLALDRQGRLHFADAGSHRVFRIEQDGRLTVVAGAGEAGHGGDGGPAANALLNQPTDIRFDAQGSLYIADVSNHRIRRVREDGTIETVAGTGEPGYSGDGGPAAAARLQLPWGIHVDTVSGDLLIGDGGNHVVRRVDRAGIITTIAGTGVAGYSGDGRRATEAQLDGPQAIAVTCSGTLIIGDEHNHALRTVDSTGVIRTVMGNGKPGLAPDAIDSRSGQLNDPENIAVTCDGSLYVTDGDNGRLLRVDPAGRVSNFAGRPAGRTSP